MQWQAMALPCHLVAMGCCEMRESRKEAGGIGLYPDTMSPYHSSRAEHSVCSLQSPFQKHEAVCYGEAHPVGPTGMGLFWGSLRAMWGSACPAWLQWTQ